MADPIKSTKHLAESYGLKFVDRGNGHVQISGHGVLVEYWPNSKKRTVYSPTLGRRETNCSPWDAVNLCRQGARPGMKTKAAKERKGPAQTDLAPVKTNPAGLKHFYSGDVPPWDQSLGEFQPMTESDALRMKARALMNEVIAIQASANDLDAERTS